MKHLVLIIPLAAIKDAKLPLAQILLSRLRHPTDCPEDQPRRQLETLEKRDDRNSEVE